MAKNPLRTFLGLNCLKNKNIKAWPKKRSSYIKKGCSRERIKISFFMTHNKIPFHYGSEEPENGTPN